MAKPQPLAQFSAQFQAHRAALRVAIDAIALPATDDPIAHAAAIEAFTITLCALLATIPDPAVKGRMREHAKRQIDAIDTISAKASLGAGKFGTA